MATQLTTSHNIKILFSEPKENIVNDFECRRINIQTKYSFGILSIPLKYLGKRCNVNTAIKFESIFIGSKISLQVKLYELEISPIK